MQASRPSSHPAARLLARDVERIILQRIAAGRYRIGERLPSCTQFGREIGANKNTVSKAYRALAGRGYISVTAGRGTHVTALPAAGGEGAAVGEIESLLDLIAHHAYSAGISLTELEELAGRQIRRRYDHASVRVAFVECNEPEVRLLGRQLEQTLGIPVQPILLAEFLAPGRTEALIDELDVIAVSLSHVAEVEERFAGLPPVDAEIVPMLTLPDADRLAEVARLPRGTRLGVLAETNAGLDALTGFVRAFNRSVEVETALAGEAAAAAAVVERSDVLFVTVTVHKHRLAGLASKPLIDAPFKLDQRAMESLRERVLERRRQAFAAPAHASAPA
jgi:DNA-binding transcriptional regulator YhcF (GntR family)